MYLAQWNVQLRDFRVKYAFKRLILDCELKNKQPKLRRMNE